MRRVVFLFSVFLLTAISARAQSAPSEYPKGEISGGYSFYSASVNYLNPFVVNPLIVGAPIPPEFINDRQGFNGYSVGGAVNFSRSLGLAAEFAYHHEDVIKFDDAPDIDVSALTFLFGPRFTARGDKVEGFGHFLIGGTRRSLEEFGSKTDFTLGIGGGLDVKVGRNFAIRMIQFDYTPFRGIDPETICGCSSWRNNYKVGVGVTYRFE